MWNYNEAEVNKQEETTTTDEFVKIGVVGSSKVWEHIKVK